jgi:WD40 repeat protein
MNRTIILLIFLALVTVGCYPKPTSQPIFTKTPDTSTDSIALPTAALPLPSGSGAPLPTLETISEWNAPRISRIMQVGGGTFGDIIRVSPDGNLLALASSGGILLADTASGQQIGFYPTSSEIESLAFSPDGKYIATVHRGPGTELMTIGDTAGQPIYHPILTVWNLTNGSPSISVNLSGHGCGQYNARDLAYSPDGQILVFKDQYNWLGHDRTDNLCLLSAKDGNLIRAIPIDLPWNSATPVLLSPDGQELYVAVIDRTTEDFTTPTTRVRVYETNTGNLIRELDGLGSVNDMAISPDGQHLGLADQNGVRLISTKDGNFLAEFGNHSREVMSATFSPDGTTLALGSLDGTVSVWTVPEGDLLWQTQAWFPISPISLEKIEAEIWDTAFSPDGNVLFTLAPSHIVNLSGRVNALQASDGLELFSLYSSNNYIQPALSPDRIRLVFGGYEDGQAQVWSVTDNKPLFTLIGHTSMVMASSFSPDGSQIATASIDGTVRLWNSQDGSQFAVLSGHTGTVRLILFSPDGTKLISVGDDSTLRLWDTSNGKLVKIIEMQTGNWVANTIAFGPDGNVLIATGCPYSDCPAKGGGDLRRVNLEDGTVTILINQPVYSATFTPDQNGFAIWSLQGKQSGQVNQGQFQPQITYTSPLGNGVLMGTAISPDGQLFFSGNGYGLHVWNAVSGEMVALCKGSGSSYGSMWVTLDQKLILIAQFNGLMSLWGIPSDQE